MIIVPIKTINNVSEISFNLDFLKILLYDPVIRYSPIQKIGIIMIPRKNLGVKSIGIFSIYIFLYEKKRVQEMIADNKSKKIYFNIWNFVLNLIYNFKII